MCGADDASAAPKNSYGFLGAKTLAVRCRRRHARWFLRDLSQQEVRRALPSSLLAQDEPNRSMPWNGNCAGRPSARAEAARAQRFASGADLDSSHFDDLVGRGREPTAKSRGRES